METPPQITIRSAGSEDAAAIAALQAQPGFRFGTLRLPYPRPDLVRKWLEARGPDSHELLAFDGEELIGMAGVQRHAGRRAHVGGIGMGVADARTGQGIGRRLLEEVLDIADNWLGLKRVELTVYIDNAAAIALYRRFDFVVEGRHRAFALRDGVLVDAYAMARLR